MWSSSRGILVISHTDFFSIIYKFGFFIYSNKLVLGENMDFYDMISI